MKRSAMGSTRAGYNERVDAMDRFDGAEGEISGSQWHSKDEFGTRASTMAFEQRNERVSRRGVRGKGKSGSSGDRSALPKEISSERYPRVMKKNGGPKVDVSWDDCGGGRTIGRGKRSRDDGWCDMSTFLGGVRILQGEFDDGSNGPARRRGEDSRGHPLPVRSGGAEERDECESGRSFSRPRTSRIEDDERVSVRSKTELSREESQNVFGLAGRCRSDRGGDHCVEKPASDSRGGMLETGRFIGKGTAEIDGVMGGKQRGYVERESLEGKVPDSLGTFGRRNHGNGENLEKLKPGDVGDAGRDESEDGERTTGSWRVGETSKECRRSYDENDAYGDWACDWDASDDFEQGKASSKVELEKNRLRYIEIRREHDMGDEEPWNQEKRADREDLGCQNDRMRNVYREGNEKSRELIQEGNKSREKLDMDGCASDGELLVREKSKGFCCPDVATVVNEGFVGAAASVPLQLPSDLVQGTSSEALCSPRAGGESGALPGEHNSDGGDADWDGPVQEDRVRLADGDHAVNREPSSTEEEPPPGLEQVFGPSPVGVGNVYRGRGRPKCCPSSQTRGAMSGHEGRPNVVQSPVTVLITRGTQPGAKVGRGRGPTKAVRGGGRDGQRSNITVISQLRPGMAGGPVFGQLGPSGPISGLGPGIMGPGAFPLAPFGGRLGWNGGGDMGMINGPAGPITGPPRFVPGIGPGPHGRGGPNMFFSSPVRGSPIGIPLGSMCGRNAPFGGRPLPGNRVQLGGRCISRGGSSGPAGLSGLAGRGPSRGEQNDYSQHFVDTGLRPQNFIRDVDLADRFEEYPKLKELIARKDKLISERATPPMYLQCDLRSVELCPEVFGTKFDVILVDPPWEEYVRRAPGVGDSMEWWSHADIQNLRIDAISDTPAFIFLWVGDAEGLDKGRLCLKKWGFRRCEDICWVKTNRENPTPALRHDSNTVLQHSKEHCLMGIKGTVRRSTDGHIIHANVDTDIIISEEPESGSTAKPEELYHIIEHFAQGQRRIEFFGEDHNIREGWVTVGKSLSSSNFSPQAYGKYFVDSDGKMWQGGRGNPPLDAPHLVGTTSEIESLRPKSPPPRALQQPQALGANGLQTSGTNGNGKRMLTGQVGSPNVPSIPSSGQVVVYTTQIPVEIGPVGSGGSGITHTQTLQPAENVINWDTRPSVTHESIGPGKVRKEDRTLGAELAEVLSEVESGFKPNRSNPAII